MLRFGRHLRRGSTQMATRATVRELEEATRVARFYEEQERRERFWGRYNEGMKKVAHGIKNNPWAFFGTAALLYAGPSIINKGVDWWEAAARIFGGEDSEKAFMEDMKRALRDEYGRQRTDEVLYQIEEAFRGTEFEYLLED